MPVERDVLAEAPKTTPVPSNRGRSGAGVREPAPAEPEPEPVFVEPALLPEPEPEPVVVAVAEPPAVAEITVAAAAEVEPDALVADEPAGLPLSQLLQLVSDEQPRAARTSAPPVAPVEPAAEVAAADPVALDRGARGGAGSGARGRRAVSRSRARDSRARADDFGELVMDPVAAQALDELSRQAPAASLADGIPDEAPVPVVEMRSFETPRQHRERAGRRAVAAVRQPRRPGEPVRRHARDARLEPSGAGVRGAASPTVTPGFDPACSRTAGARAGCGRSDSACTRLSEPVRNVACAGRPEHAIASVPVRAGAGPRGAPDPEPAAADGGTRRGNRAGRGRVRRAGRAAGSRSRGRPTRRSPSPSWRASATRGAISKCQAGPRRPSGRSDRGADPRRRSAVDDRRRGTQGEPRRAGHRGVRACRTPRRPQGRQAEEGASRRCLARRAPARRAPREQEAAGAGRMGLVRPRAVRLRRAGRGRPRRPTQGTDGTRVRVISY